MRTLRILFMALIGINLVIGSAYATSTGYPRNPRDERGQGNMGKPNMRDPYGHDKESGREKSERGRPIREDQSKHGRPSGGAIYRLINRPGPQGGPDAGHSFKPKRGQGNLPGHRVDPVVKHPAPPQQKIISDRDKCEFGLSPDQKKKADTNRDGVVTRSERKVYEFGKIDTNHDGRINPAEIRAFQDRTPPGDDDNAP